MVHEGKPTAQQISPVSTSLKSRLFLLRQRCSFSKDANEVSLPALIFLCSESLEHACAGDRSAHAHEKGSGYGVSTGDAPRDWTSCECDGQLPREKTVSLNAASHHLRNNT